MYILSASPHEGEECVVGEEKGKGTPLASL